MNWKLSLHEGFFSLEWEGHGLYRAPEAQALRSPILGGGAEGMDRPALLRRAHDVHEGEFDTDEVMAEFEALPDLCLLVAVLDFTPDLGATNIDRWERFSSPTYS